MSNRSQIIDGSQTKGVIYGLIYTKKCGWVDLGHANPVDGVDVLWRKIKWERGVTHREGYYSLVYSQKMKKMGVTVGTYGTYEIKKGLNLFEQRSVALAIFLNISHQFEMMQGNWLFKHFTDSGYSAEDLVSNLIGFYRALYPNKNILALCEPVSKEIALQIWDTYGSVGSNKNSTTQPYLYPHSESKNSEVTSVDLPTLLTTAIPANEGDLFRELKMGARGRRHYN